MLLKRAMKGELDLMTPAMAVQKELMSIPDFGAEDETLFSAEKKILAQLKKSILMVAGTAVQKYMMSLAKEQEILMNIADMAIDVFVAESLLLRLQKLVDIKGESACSLELDILRVYFSNAIDSVNLNGRTAINSMCEGDEQRMLLMGLKRFTKPSMVNTKDARRRIAAALCEANRYCF
jgi:hypothetical protein